MAFQQHGGPGPRPVLAGPPLSVATQPYQAGAPVPFSTAGPYQVQPQSLSARVLTSSVTAAPQSVTTRYAAAGQPVYSSTPTFVAGTPQPYLVQAGKPFVSGTPVPVTGSTQLPAGARVIRTSHAAPIVQTIRAPVTTAQGAVQTRPHTLAGPGYTQGAYEVKHEQDPQLQNLKELRKSSGLKGVPVVEGLQAFKKAATDGRLSREKFLETYAELLKAHNIESPTDQVKNAVFDLFDRDENHVVDMMELICGISLLCDGKEDDKIHAVFGVFDENGDGFISMDEMYKFLTSVFKVVLTPNVLAVMNTMGVSVESAEDLASVTSLECFKTADLNHDGKLSEEEFKAWFNAPRNDPSFLFSPVRKLLE